MLDVSEMSKFYWMRHLRKFSLDGTAMVVGGAYIYLFLGNNRLHQCTVTERKAAGAQVLSWRSKTVSFLLRRISVTERHG